MQCLLCNQKLTNKENLKDHYVKSHKVNENNVFFKKLIDQKKNNVMYKRNCNYCNEFVFANKTKHDFLKHYMIGAGGGGGGGNDDDDDDDDDAVRPLNVTYLGVIKKFEITFKEHSSYYDFFDSVALVDGFLAEIKNYIFRYNNDVLIRAGFCIENIIALWASKQLTVSDLFKVSNLNIDLFKVSNLNTNTVALCLGQLTHILGFLCTTMHISQWSLILYLVIHCLTMLVILYQVYVLYRMRILHLFTSTSLGCMGLQTAITVLEQLTFLLFWLMLAHLLLVLVMV